MSVAPAHLQQPLGSASIYNLPHGPILGHAAFQASKRPFVVHCHERSLPHGAHNSPTALCSKRSFAPAPQQASSRLPPNVTNRGKASVRARHAATNGSATAKDTHLKSGRNTSVTAPRVRVDPQPTSSALRNMLPPYERRMASDTNTQLLRAGTGSPRTTKQCTFRPHTRQYTHFDTVPSCVGGTNTNHQQLCTAQCSVV